MCQIVEVDDEWNILKCTLHWRRVQKISITLAILEEILVISIFHETKIPTVDMKVQVYFKFWKKVKSPISMRNGTFNTSKCRGKLQKKGVLYTHSSKSPSPFPKLPKKNPKNKKYWIYNVEVLSQDPINKKNFISLIITYTELRSEPCVLSLIWKW
jgi:hypothetical protein